MPSDIVTTPDAPALREFLPPNPLPVMMRFVVVAALALAAASPASAQTRMLRSPSVSQRHITFAHAGNIWIVERAGGAARRLTSFAGEAGNPKLSPDGSRVAFSAQYAGNVDVYVLPVEGGEPKRLTYHPGPDLVQGWTPDGSAPSTGRT